MRNRIGHLVPQALSQSNSQSHSHSQLCHRPTLTLKADRPITVDMERFFDFSFSFAEELLDLEEKYMPATAVVPLQREFGIKEAETLNRQDGEHDLDIDARWM